MKPYGMDRLNYGDTDVSGCVENGRASATYNLAGKSGDVRSYRSLRNGKKAAIRRRIKRIARRQNKVLCEGE